MCRNSSISNRQGNSVDNGRGSSNRSRISRCLRLRNIRWRIVATKVPTVAEKSSAAWTCCCGGEGQEGTRNSGVWREDEPSGKIQYCPAQSVVDDRRINARTVNI